MTEPSGVADATTWGQFFLFLTTVAGFWFQYIREGRRQRWEAEERIRQAAEVQRQVRLDAERVKETLKQETASIQERHTETQQQLEENTEISRRAFYEANNINRKLVAMGHRFDALLSRQDVGEEDRAVVQEMQQNVKALAEQLGQAEGEARGDDHAEEG
jgi:type II secretory pathway pseudopilin PulG